MMTPSSFLHSLRPVLSSQFRRISRTMTAWSLFPLPSRPEPVWGQTPYPLPGVTAESSETLKELMNQNSERFHIYFNDRGFRKYVTYMKTLFAALLYTPSPLAT